ncbi:MAG: PAS domain-containing sensor histidine kinase [Bacteroidales bacterium]|nr:PAS domain-containing sensor histidine kinase [Bacteroidales bacterium]
MSGTDKTNEQLLEEIGLLESRINELEQSEISHIQTKADLKNIIAKWQITLDSMSDSVCIVSLDGEIQHYNSATLSMFNLGKRDIRGEYCYQLFHGTQNFHPNCPLKRMKDSQGVESVIIEDGNRWLEISVDPIFDANMKPIAAVHVVSDITERKHREYEIDAIFNTAANGMRLISNDYTIKRVNNTFCEMVGLSSKDIIGKKCYDIFAGSSCNTKDCSLRKLKRREEKRFSIEIVMKRSDSIDVSTSLTATSFLDSDGNFVGIIEDFRDITELKLAEDALIKSEQQYRLLAISTLDTIWTTDLEFNLTFVNDAIFSFLGYTKEEFLGMHPTRFTTPEGIRIIENAALQLGTAYKSGDIIQVIIELQQIKKDGALIDVELRCNLLQDADGQITGFYGRSVDITESKKAEQMLLDALEKATESDRLKSAFLANMSHEIRTPMNGIMGFAELLNEPGLSGDEVKSYVKIIEKSGERMLGTINDLIEMSKLEAGQVFVSAAEVNVNDLLKDIYTFFKPEIKSKGLKFAYNDLATDLHQIIKTDGDKLYGIIANLVKNAIKYSHSGSIEFGYQSKDNFLEFYIKDTGIGIPQDRQRDVFERFIQVDMTKTRSYEGAGLGLAITKANVELLGGKIWVESKEGKGSTFYFTIPS